MLTMLSALDNALKLHGDRPAIVDEEQCFTWSQHVGRVAKAAGLCDLGIGPGDRYGIICENSFRYTELIHAGYWSGAIAVPINHRLAAPEILHILEDADCRALALGKPFLNLTDTAELAPWRDQTIYLGPPDGEISQPQYEALLTAAPSAPQCPVVEDDLAILLLLAGQPAVAKASSFPTRMSIPTACRWPSPWVPYPPTSISMLRPCSMLPIYCPRALRSLAQRIVTYLYSRQQHL